MIKTVGLKGFIGLVFCSAVAGAQIAPSANQAFNGLKITLCGTSLPYQRRVALRLA